jgi:hypothetical protein
MQKESLISSAFKFLWFGLFLLFLFLFLLGGPRLVEFLSLLSPASLDFSHKFCELFPEPTNFDIRVVFGLDVLLNCRWASQPSKFICFGPVSLLILLDAFKDPAHSLNMFVEFFDLLLVEPGVVLLDQHDVVDEHVEHAEQLFVVGVLVQALPQLQQLER